MRHGWKERQYDAATVLLRLTAVGLGLLIGLWAPAPAHARPSQHIALELSAPASCPDTRALLQNVDAQLGEDFSTDSELRASVQVRELGPADYELQLRYRTDSGAEDERRLRGESCREVTDAAALLLAIALNPGVALPSAEQDRASQPAWAARVGLTAVLDTALLRAASFGAGIVLGLRIGPLELSARGQWFFPPSTARAGTTTTWDAYSFDLGACAPWQLGRMTLGPCVRAEVGRLAAAVAGPVEEQRPGGARFQALAVGAEVRVRVAYPLWLTLTADFAWFLRRPQFVVADLGEVGRPAEFGMRAYLGPLLAW